MQLNTILALAIGGGSLLVSAGPLDDPNVLGKRGCGKTRNSGAGCSLVNDVAEMKSLLEAPDSAVQVSYNRIMALDVVSGGCWIAGDAAMANLQDVYARWTAGDTDTATKRDAESESASLFETRSCNSCTNIGNSACSSDCPSCHYETLCGGDCACVTYGICKS